MNRKMFGSHSCLLPVLAMGIACLSAGEKAYGGSKQRAPGAFAGLPEDPAAVGLTAEPYRQYVMLLHDLGRKEKQ